MRWSSLLFAILFVFFLPLGAQARPSNHQNNHGFMNHKVGHHRPVAPHHQASHLRRHLPPFPWPVWEKYGVKKVQLDSVNSPVAEDVAKFQLTWKAKAPIERAEYWFDMVPHRGHLSRQKSQKVGLDKVGDDQYIIGVPADTLSPGEHTLYLVIVTKPWWKAAWQHWLSRFGLRQVDPDFPRVVVQSAFSIDASLEVPDPGEAGRQTLAGIDSDNDGIRDDIQRWINEKYHNSPRSLAAAKQEARDAQTVMLSSNDKQKAIQAIFHSFDSMHCMESIIGFNVEYQFSHQLKARMENTRDRIEAGIHNDGNFNGQFVEATGRSEWASKCNFDVNSLPQ